MRPALPNGAMQSSFTAADARGGLRFMLTASCACSQLDKRTEADGGRDGDEAESTLRWPSPQRPPAGVRDVSTPWWKGKSLRSSSRKPTSPSRPPATQAAAAHVGPPSPAAVSPASSPTKISDEAGPAETSALPAGPGAAAVLAKAPPVRRIQRMPDVRTNSGSGRVNPMHVMRQHQSLAA